MRTAYLFNGKVYLNRALAFSAVFQHARGMGLFLEKQNGEEGLNGIWFNFVQLDGSQGFKKDHSFADAFVSKYPVVE